MVKNIKKGMQRINPLNDNSKIYREFFYLSQFDLVEEAQDKLELATKLYNGVNLTRLEKQRIYKYLTGISAPPNVKRGTRPKIVRDVCIARDYLEARVVEGTVKASLIMKKLAKIYDISGEIKDDMVDVREDTFYKAVNNGLAHLETSANGWIESVENGVYEDMSQNRKDRLTALARLHLELISKYKQNQVHKI